ncbi:hypothetical protein CHS0354_011849, partial [Potamilus streckersoni]
MLTLRLLHYKVSSLHASASHVESTTVSTATTHTSDTTTIFIPLPTTPIVINPCDKYETINSLAHGTVFSHPDASDCVKGDHRASEALVVELCHTNGAHNWTKGPALAAQECFTNSTVLHIEHGGLFARDPSIYH